jgi:hypothetical protein
MAAISNITASGQIGAFTATESTLSASDTITVLPGKTQLMVLRNATAGSLTLNIDGAGGTTLDVLGYGVVSLASGLNIVLAAGEQKAVILSTINSFLQGVVTLTGASGVKIQIFTL